MPRGCSIHVGLNHVDPTAYNGWDGALSGCINDANDMKAIADSLGYQSSLLIDSQATASAVICAIGQASQTLQSGDILVLTYSGHGGQFDDVNGDEDDGKDETWVLWDRQLLDDELYALWPQFAAGVRVFVVSDSCHSGTVLRVVAAREMYQTSQKTKAEPPKFRVVTDEDREKYFDPDPKIRAMGETVQWLAGPSDKAMIQARILLISGCQDNQLSADGTGNGLFTEKVKQVWSSGAFTGDYRKFWQDVRALMPMQQLPNYFVVGANNPTFEQQKPFTIGGAGGSSTPTTPSTTTRRTLRRGDSGPDVTYLQQRLQAHGQSVSVDGIFGGGTEAQVMTFQRNHSLPVDGVVGSNTWQTLDAAPSGAPATPSTPGASSGGSTTGGGSQTHPTLSVGSQGPAVQHLQQLLIDDGAALVADGFFGQKTASAVRAFQTAHGLTADGIVGPGTWNALEPTGCKRSADELVTV